MLFVFASQVVLLDREIKGEQVIITKDARLKVK